MKKRIAALSLALSLLITSQVQGQPFYAACECPNWELKAGAIFWRLGACDTRYAGRGIAELPPEGVEPFFLNRDDEYVPHHWAWGWRLEGRVDLGHHLYIADYTWWESTGAATVARGVEPAEGGFLVIPGVNGNWETAEGSQRLSFQQATLRFHALTSKFHDVVNTYASVFARFIYARNQVRSRTTNPTVFVDGDPVTFGGVVGRGEARQGFTGVGPGVDFLVITPFLFGLELYSGGSVNAIIGRSTKGFSNFAWDPIEPIPGTSLALRTDPVWYWVPGFDFQTVFSYSYECGCFKGAIQIGWQTFFYSGALFDLPDPGFVDRGEPVGDNQAPNALRDSAFKGLVMGGPILNLQVEF